MPTHEKTDAELLEEIEHAIRQVQKLMARAFPPGLSTTQPSRGSSS